VIYRSTTITSPGANHEQALAYFYFFFPPQMQTKKIGNEKLVLPSHFVAKQGK
jgi:hypothetical protein